MPRLDGIDLARAVAILGMFIMHSWYDLNPDIGWLGVAEGRATVLFCVLAGVSVVFLTRRRSVGASLVQLIGRGVFLALVGLAISSEAVGPMVILTTYGAFYALLAPFFFRAPLPVLAMLTAVTAVAAPIASFLIRQQIAPPPPFGAIANFAMLAEGHWLPAIQYTLVSGAFPLLTFLPFFLGGMAVAHAILRWRQAWVWLAVLGVGLAALGQLISHWFLAQTDFVERYSQFHPEGAAATEFLLNEAFGVTPLDTWAWLLIYVPHSGSITEIVAGLGTSLAVIGLSLILCRMAPVLAVTWPLRALGRIPLSAYVAHILFIGLLVRNGRNINEPVFATLNLIVPVVFAMVWLHFFRRGPLEQLMASMFGPVSRMVARVGNHEVR